MNGLPRTGRAWQMTLAINVLKGQGPGTAVGKNVGKTGGTGKLLCGQQGIVPGGPVCHRSCLFPVSLEGEGAGDTGQTLDRSPFRPLATTAQAGEMVGAKSRVGWDPDWLTRNLPGMGPSVVGISTSISMLSPSLSPQSILPSSSCSPTGCFLSVGLKRQIGAEILTGGHVSLGTHTGLWSCTLTTDIKPGQDITHFTTDSVLRVSAVTYRPLSCSLSVPGRGTA